MKAMSRYIKDKTANAHHKRRLSIIDLFPKHTLDSVGGNPKPDAEIPQIQIEVADVNSNVQFLPNSTNWQTPKVSMDDDDYFDNFDDGEEEEVFGMGFKVTPNDHSVDQLIIRLYERACKMYKRLPLTRIKNTLLKSTLSCRFLTLQDSDCVCIGVALCDNRFVKCLDFQQNGMSPKSAYHLAEVIDNSSFLTHIRIVDNNLGSEGARVICEAVKENRMIVSLDLSGNGLVETDGEVFEMLIRESIYIEELYLKNNELMDYGVRKIADALKENTSLTVLDLSWNHIRLGGAVAIGEALEKNNSLLTVNLAWNGLHQDGAESIAFALTKNDTLIELDLTCNRLTEQAVAEILRGLDHNTTLSTLRIGQNHVTTRGALMILKHINENPSSLTVLDLGNQEVHDKFVELYEEMKKERDLNVIYGAVLSLDRDSLTKSTVDENEIALLSCNPLTVIMECMRLQNMRMIDFFKRLDTNQSNMICINELSDGMMRFGIPIRRETLLRLLFKLDKDKNGQLDYSEMIEAQNIHRHKLRKMFAESLSIDSERTEIGRVSVILRRIMSKRLIMKKSHSDTRRHSAKKSREISRSNTPSPFPPIDIEKDTASTDLIKSFLGANKQLSSSTTSLSLKGRNKSTDQNILDVNYGLSLPSSVSSRRSSYSSCTLDTSSSNSSRASSASSSRGRP